MILLMQREAKKKFFRYDRSEKSWVLRQQKDEHFKKICRFFDTTARRCTVYAARPAVCRSFPDQKTCGYWDFLVFERRHQRDPDGVAITENGRWA